ncbi:hypothetical protein [Dyadobacter sp. CY356]|uniref:hypothetical protein n=1 Tax=Dyadobacter sp. CY356 TaxID=2906442 RepID=UPI001F361143|nr:hypothetical protein [Dyadobacter sp. CY356]MCF0057121.1 hypothetical protein [Dyadobacter sp. CY356]
MGRIITRLIPVCFVILSVLQISYGQNRKWEFGVSVSSAKESYHNRYYGPPVGSGAVYNFKSLESWGVGVFGEKHISDKFSLVTKIGYSTQQVPVNTLCQCSYTANVWLQEERHHQTSAGLDFRAYIISKSAVKVFGQAGLEGDYFLGYMEKRDNKKHFYRNARTFNRFVPGYTASLGLQWKRVGLMGEYHGNIGRAFYRNQLIDGENIKRESIYRQGYSIKASFVIF